jgi:hypothetical protein
MKTVWTLTEESVFSLVMLAVGVVFLVVAQPYPAQSKFFPTLVLVPMILGFGANAIMSAKVPESERDKGMAKLPELGAVVFWVVLLVGLMLLIGLVGSMTVFPLLYMRFYCKESWRVTLLVTAFIAVGTWAFITFLQIPMYFGVILETLGF